MLDNIEDKYFSSERACNLDKAWFGLHYAFNGGQWIEDDSTSSKIIFSGEFLLDFDSKVITLKTMKDIDEIVDYLNSIENNFKQIVEDGFNNTRAEDLDLPKDENLLEFLQDWSSDLISFYRNAQSKSFNVIFTVDL